MKEFKTGLPSSPWSWTMLLGLLIMPGLCKAEGRCPVLNAATASGALGGPVAMTVQKAADNGTVCVFRYQKGTSARSMQISVSDVKDASKGTAPYESECTSPATPLRAIGNEAVWCAHDDGSSNGEQVISRVRDKVFVITLRANSGNDPLLSRDLLKDKIENLAEQVAGSLF